MTDELTHNPTPYTPDTHPPYLPVLRRPAPNARTSNSSRCDGRLAHHRMGLHVFQARRVELLLTHSIKDGYVRLLDPTQV